MTTASTVRIVSLAGLGLLGACGHRDCCAPPAAGGEIAFQRVDGSGYEIYVMNADGSGATNLTSSPANDFLYLGAWSPDGSKLVLTARNSSSRATATVTTRSS